MELLEDLLFIQSVSGNETEMAHFLKKYVLDQRHKWRVMPEIFYGQGFQDCILLKFGTPRTAIIAHIDTIGFISRYENQLLPIGGPEIIGKTNIVGRDKFGAISCTVQSKNDLLFHDFGRSIVPGTCFSYEQNYQIDDLFIQGAYLDNRLGIYNALKQCEDLENGWVIFTTYEEHGGGSLPFLLRFIQENSPIQQALISDITWISEGICHHEGVVISIRDKFIPRRSFVDRIVTLAEKSGIPFQLEVEGSGASDGREVQFSPYAIDWCFIGAPEENAHTPIEVVSLHDLNSMIELYRFLMTQL